MVKLILVSLPKRENLSFSSIRGEARTPEGKYAPQATAATSVNLSEKF